MKIGVSSQNFRTITGHAGKGRRFLVFEQQADGLHELDRIDLPKEMSMQAFSGDDHPLDLLDVLITAGCGDGFIRRMASRNVQVITTAESSPTIAVEKFLTGEDLLPAIAHEH